MSRGLQVALIGLKSNFGRVASLLLKQSPAIKNLELYDDVDASTAVDVACIATDCKVRAYQGKEHLHSALKDSNIIIIGDDGQQPADNSKEALDKLLASRIPKIMEYTKAMADVAPNALVVVAASPMNSIVPLVAQGLAAEGCLDPNKILGCTAADSAKASTLLARALSMDPAGVLLPVIGGSSPNTRVPIFSQAKPKLDFNLDNTENFGLMKNTKENKEGYEMLDKTYISMNLNHSSAAALNINAENSVTKGFVKKEDPEHYLIHRNLSFPLTLMRSPCKPTSPLPSLKLCKTCPQPNLSLPGSNDSSCLSVIPPAKKLYNILETSCHQLGFSSIKQILSPKLCSIFNPQIYSVVYYSRGKSSDDECPPAPPRPPSPYLCPTCPQPCPPPKCPPSAFPPPCCHPPKPPPKCISPCLPLKPKEPKKK